MKKALSVITVLYVCCYGSFPGNNYQKLNSRKSQLEDDLSKIIDDEIGTWCEPREDENLITNTAGPRKRPQVPSKTTTGSESLSIEEDEVENIDEGIAEYKRMGDEIKEDNIDSEQLARWGSAALKICLGLGQIRHNDVPALYFASPTNAKQHAILPDNSLKRVRSHDSWLVLDFFPHAMMGHTLYLFGIETNMTEQACLKNKGILVGPRECMFRILKSRCNQFIDRRRSTNQRRRHPFHQKKCEIDFLPLVHLVNSAPRQIEQRLVCRDNIPGYANCPSLRSREETAEIICDPLSTNTKRCDTTHEYVRTRCRAFETCDQAVILAGGWNWQMSGYDSLSNVLSMYKLLRHNGFGKPNVKIFFANGVRISQELERASVNDEEHQPSLSPPQNPAMYPSALKLALRYHTRTLCSTSHCVDSLVIYLSSPTRSDGAMYLWDSDGNGIADETEVYLIREFLRDIQDCQARHLVIIADQTQAGILVDIIAKSKKHKNAIVLASGRPSQISMNNEFTRHWTGFKHAHICVTDVFNASISTMAHSTPYIYDGTNGSKRLNIFGAPCDVLPPFTRQELRSHFMGCQNIPTRIWLNKNSRVQTDPPPRYLSG
ncbi:uncharacterized protein LOC136027444 [Artemia franciscana]|uniref:Uncharacterized protein n=1 Tax=Artemia franciscana TaxID=6661 RepID=A0AA88HQE7_ARTSF|nr:hypothetical protein QYM36_013573 [Artemia franciscana]